MKWFVLEERSGLCLAEMTSRCSCGSQKKDRKPIGKDRAVLTEHMHI
jgi:hypothetical protein